MTKENIVKLVNDAVADNPFTDDALASRFSEQHSTAAGSLWTCIFAHITVNAVTVFLTAVFGLLLV